MDRLKPQNTILVAMWCSNVPLTRPSLHFVYHPVSVQYNGMPIVSDYFRIEKNKYHDTVVLLQISNGECEPFYIDLICFYTCQLIISIWDFTRNICFKFIYV
jgi:hypothetical protein